MFSTKSVTCDLAYKFVVKASPHNKAVAEASPLLIVNTGGVGVGVGGTAVGDAQAAIVPTPVLKD